MSRRSPRVRARFAATVQIAGVDHTLICHTRDISAEGCFLETAEGIPSGVGVALSVLDNQTGDVVSVEGHVTRVDGDECGVGVRLIDPPDDWCVLVERFQGSDDQIRPALRLSVLVVSSEANRRGALALYVTSGWDIRFAVDVPTADEAFEDVELDAIIAEFEADEPAWKQVMEAAIKKQPNARRLVRCRTADVQLPPSGADEVVHRFVEIENGMDALLDALTAELGAYRQALADPTTGAIPATDTTAGKVLQGILKRVSDEEGAIAVFDLDSTLLDNSPRQSAIMREYGNHAGVVELQSSRPEHWVTWDMGDAMAKTGLDAEGIEIHLEAFKAFWMKRFFTSKYCLLDEAIDGAPAFVNAVRDHGGRVFYVTGRHEEMRAGTLECLKRLSFPIPSEDSNVELLMKPVLEESDDDYKARTHQQLQEAGCVVTAFDNEPTHINGYRCVFPDATTVHLATDHSGRDVKVFDGIVSIVDFAATG